MNIFVWKWSRIAAQKKVFFCCWFCPPMASVLLSASVERCFVSRMRDLFPINQILTSFLNEGFVLTIIVFGSVQGLSIHFKKIKWINGPSSVHEVKYSVKTTIQFAVQYYVQCSTDNCTGGYSRVNYSILQCSAQCWL